MPVEDYEKTASLYDPLLNPFLDTLRRDSAGLLGGMATRTVVDLCCGTGRQAIMLHDAGMKVTGVDLSPAMLAVARRNSPPTIAYHEKDATDTGLPTRSYDAVVLSFALHEMAEPLRMALLAEASRLCTDGGTILILDYRRPDSLPGRIVLQPIRLIERIAGREHHANFKDYMNQGATAGLLDRAGMRGTLEEEYFRGCAGTYLAGPTSG